MPQSPAQRELPLMPLPEFREDAIPERFGPAEVSTREASSILTKPSGFIEEYDFTLNPYSGCSFGCSYCYAAFFAPEQDLRDRWGYWVTVKSNAVSLLRRRRKSLRGKNIYMSSVTDPYQPIEKKLGMVRAILAELQKHQARLVIQTRSPVVVRDLDLLRQYDSVRVNMTITTDSERVRKGFEPLCASIDQRLEAVRQVQEAGVPVCVTMTPLLPVEQPERFAERLLATGVESFVVQDFSVDRGRFVAGTRERARELAQEMNWDAAAYRRVVEILDSKLPNLMEGRDGFAPSPAE